MTRTVILFALAIGSGCSADPVVEPTRLSVDDESQRLADPPRNLSTAVDATSTQEHGMRDEFFKFIQSPDRDAYLELRSKIISSAAYEPYSDELNTAVELLEENKFNEARDAIRNAMPNLMLSPRAHRLLGFLHHKLGDEKAAQMEMSLAHACLQGILATGNGSADSPYIVMRTSDEYDVIEHLEKRLNQQSLTNKGERHFDLLKCTDGSEYWFDITDPYNQLSKKFGE